MSIEFRCQVCGKLYSVSETLVGKKVRCKGCASVMLVAGKVAKSAVQPVRAKVSAAPVPSEDPFENPDAFMASGDGGVAEEAAPYVPPVSRAPVADWDYVSIPGEEAIDRFVPWLPVGVFAAFLIMILVRGISTVNEFATQFGLNDNEKARGIGRVCGMTFGIAVAVAGISAPLCLIGVYVASRIMKFKNRPLLYWKCLAVVCTPWAMSFAFNGFDLNQSLLSTSLYLSVPVMVGVLWLLVRLKAAPFAVAAVFVVGLCVGLPATIGYAVKPRGFVEMQRPDGAGAGTSPAKPMPGTMEPKALPLPAGSMAAVRRAAAKRRMLEIWGFVGKYAAAHHGRYPATLEEIGQGDLLQFTESGHQFTFFYHSGGGSTVPLPEKLIVVSTVVEGETPGVDHYEWLALFGDGQVKSFGANDPMWKAADRESAAIEEELRRALVAGPRPEPSATALVDASTPKGALVAFMVALGTGDAGALNARTYNVDPEVLAAYTAYLGATRELNVAASRRFSGQGKSAPPGASSVEELTWEIQARMERSPEQIDGDTATVGPPAEKPIQLKKIDGQWRVDFKPVLEEFSKELTSLGIPGVKVSTRVTREMIQEVSEGKYADWPQVQAALKEKTRAARDADPDCQAFKKAAVQRGTVREPLQRGVMVPAPAER